VAGIAVAGGERHPQSRAQGGDDGTLGKAEQVGDGGAGTVSDEVEGEFDAVERRGGYVGTAVPRSGQVCGGRVRACSVRSGHSGGGVLSSVLGGGGLGGVAEHFGQGRDDYARVARHEGGQGMDGHQVTVAPGDDRAPAGEKLFDLKLVG
jgi:hypothetical protein